MFHCNTELLIERWRAQGLPRQVPTRHGFDLDGLQHLAPHLFVIGRRQPGDYPFRLTGELVRDLHGRRLLGEDLTGLFTLTGRIELRPALEAARRGRASLIAIATARTLDGHAAPFQNGWIVAWSWAPPAPFAVSVA